MSFSSASRRVSYWFLCGLPILTTVLISVRALRVSPVYQSVGLAIGVAIMAALWVHGVHRLQDPETNAARMAWTSALFAAPSLLTGSLWVGLGIPAQATAAENLMRYEVLLAAAVAITGGFALLHDSLANAEQRVLDALLFAASALTYLTTALTAHALGRVKWLSPRTASAYTVVSVLALVALVARGVAFPDPLVGPPWYTQIGFIVGIPAVPWVVPFLLGVVVLRRLNGRPVA